MNRNQDNSDTDTESVASDDAMDLFDEIYDFDDPEDDDKIDAKYYIGIYYYNVPDLIMGSTVYSKTFYQYNNRQLLYYLANYSYIHIKKPVLHIMQLHIRPDSTYAVVLKTHWIKLIQRTWKRVLKERNQMIARRAWANYSFETNGKWPSELRRLPGLRGSLAYLKVSKYKN
jgi:hypothetical protein